jgi:glycosyltransferase involved in cell wall biosynthesis
MSVLESFAMGVPVIAADIGGLSELVTPQADQQPERTAEMHAASMADSTADSMADAMNASITVSGAASKLASEARLDAERRIDCSVASHDAWPNGWTFESGDERALARLLDEVGGMSDTRVAQMGRAAREHVQRHFSTDAYYDRMTEVYSSLGVRMPRPRSGS